MHRRKNMQIESCSQNKVCQLDVAQFRLIFQHSYFLYKILVHRLKRIISESTRFCFIFSTIRISVEYYQVFQTLILSTYGPPRTPHVPWVPCAYTVTMHPPLNLELTWDSEDASSHCLPNDPNDSVLVSQEFSISHLGHLQEDHMMFQQGCL